MAISVVEQAVWDWLDRSSPSAAAPGRGAAGSGDDAAGSAGAAGSPPPADSAGFAAAPGREAAGSGDDAAGTAAAAGAAGAAGPAGSVNSSDSVDPVGPAGPSDPDASVDSADCAGLAESAGRGEPGGRAGGGGFRVASGAVVVESVRGGGLRVVSLPGRPGVTPPPRARARAGSAGVGGVDARRLDAVYAWWLRSKAGWVDPGWYHAPLRGEVRALLRLDPGAQLAEALSRVAWFEDGSCPGGHDGEPGWDGSGVGRVGVPCACLVVVAAAWEVVASWAAQRASGALVHAAGAVPVRVGGGEPGGGVVDPARDELAVALRISPDSAASRIRTARGVHALPVVTDLVQRGLVSFVAARMIAGLLAEVSSPCAVAISEVVAVKVRDRHVRGVRPYGWRDLRELVTRLVAAAPAAELAAARARARNARRVWVSQGGHGMATISAEIPDVDAHRIHARLTAIATSLTTPDDTRTRDQRRADAFTDLLLQPPTHTGGHGCGTGTGTGGCGHACGGGTGTGHGCGCATGCGTGAGTGCTGRGGTDPSGADGCPDGQTCTGGCSTGTGTDGFTGGSGSGCTGGHGCGCGQTCTGGHGSGAGTGVGVNAGVGVNVTVSLAVLLGLAEDPADVSGLGPIPADLARELAADGAWRAWITDSLSGHVIATSPTTYRLPAAVQRLIRAREPYCRFPGCRRAATHCDLDHTITFPRGPSEAWNLGPLCRRHHNNKTHHNYRLTGPPDPDTAATDASWTWTTPTGQTSHDHPDPPLR